MSKGSQTRSGADAGIGQYAVGADFDGFVEHDLALENAVDVDEHIAPADQTSANVDACRVGQAYALLHQPFGSAALGDAFQLGQLYFAVNAEHFPFVFRVGGTNRQARLDGHADDVGQVILLLRVVVRQATQPFIKARGRHGHDAGIDFTDAAFSRRRILLLDDTYNLPGVVAHDTPIAVRIGQLDSQDGQSVVSSVYEPVQCFGLYQWHVTVQDERRALVFQMRQGLLHGVPGAELGLL